MSLGSHTGGLPYQKLTPDYLANQLPIFHERISKSPQDSLRFPTSSPTNLPTPPLLPGEVIELQQHRVVCTDVFSEAAVGALFLTNYRLIFHGNYISDPESLDVLHEVQFSSKKESFSGEAMAKGSTRSLMRLGWGKGPNEPSFNSYLTNPQQKVPDQPNWFQSGLKKLGSLRRSPTKRSASENALPTITTTLSTSPVLLSPPARLSVDYEDLPGAGLSTHANAKQKRKAVFLHYSQHDTISLDSVSSLSEFSEATTTETDETPDRDGRISPTLGEREDEHLLVGADFFVGAPIEVHVGRISESLPIPAVRKSALPDDSCNTVDSGINLAESAGISLHHRQDLASEHEDMTPLQNGAGMAAIEVDFEKSLDPSIDSGLGLRRELAQRGDLYRRHGSLLTPVSGSDSTEDLEETLKADSKGACPTHFTDCVFSTSYSKLAILEPISNPKSRVLPREPSESEAGMLKSDQATESIARDDAEGIFSTSYSKLAILGPIGERKSRTLPSGVSQAAEGDRAKEAATVLKDDRADMTTFGSTQTAEILQSVPAAADESKLGGAQCVGASGGASTTDRSLHEYTNICFSMGTSVVPEGPRPRSSSTPRLKKKPKPLPRKTTLQRLDKEMGSGDGPFVASLPSDFRPVPLPRRPREANNSQEELEFLASLPGSFTPANEEGAQIKTKDGNAVTDSCVADATKSHDSSADVITKSHDLPSDQSSVVADNPTPDAHTDAGSKEPASSSVTPAPADSEEVRSKSMESRPMPPIPPPRRRKNARTLPPSRAPVLAKFAKAESFDVTTANAESPDKSPDSSDKSPDVLSDQSASNSPPRSADAVSSGNPSPELEVLPRKRSSTETPTLDQPSFLLPSLMLPGNRSFEDDSSTASLFVNRSSTGSSQRPFSVATSPFDASSGFSFNPDRESGQFVQRNGVLTWSPRTKLKRHHSPLPASTRYTLAVSLPLTCVHSVRKIPSVGLKEVGIKLPEGLLILSRTFHSLHLHIHPHNTYNVDGLKELLERHSLVAKPVQQTFAFRYHAAIRHPNPTFLTNRSLPNFFHLSDELERLGLQNSKLWRVTRLVEEHSDICQSYPPRLVVPIVTPEMDLLRGARLYHEGRFPTISWVHRGNGAALLRAAATATERGQANSHLTLDEALLHAICGCNENAKGDAKLYVFTEKTETSGFKNVSTPDPMHTTLTAKQVRTYYYHNCQFVYAMNPPTFKSVRHSFNKLQAMLENKLPDEEYLIALDTTHWLTRASELLSTASSIAHTLHYEAAHVLVCYESGWDRTTQVVSLAELLLDPYYRTMDGFQVLVQKEWLWFGHPFQARHTRRGKVKSDGPIFLQWVDCVWQIVHQCPSAFEFNEKFLMSLVEHSYNSLFGTFMMNSEAERHQYFSEKGCEHMTVSSHTVSFWTWVAMVNAAGRTFFNRLYDPNTHTRVIYPRSAVPCLKLWVSHYCKYKPQENASQVSTLQRQLEELLKLYKKLSVESNLHPLEANSAAATKSFSTSPPPQLRDESQEWKRHEPTSPVLGRAGGKQYAAKPTSNKSSKPKKQFESIEQYLRDRDIDPTICKHIELYQNICQGYLIKLGGVRRNWRKRWFILDFDCQYLAYFEDHTACLNKERPKGVIHLNEITNVYQSTKRREHLIKNIFTLETPTRTYLFQAPTILTMELWMACLRIPISSLFPNA